MGKIIKNMKTFSPILITGVPRSGATFIARILGMCGVNMGKCNIMYENAILKAVNAVTLSDLEFPNINLEVVDSLGYKYFKKHVEEILFQQNIFQNKFVFKDSNLTLSWRYWHKLYPDAQWIIVRRKTPHIINSCMETAYMDLMKNKQNLNAIGVKNEKEGWLWLVHQYENQWREMLKEGITIQEVYPDRMENKDYSKIAELVDNLGLTWTDKILTTMSRYFGTEKV